MHRLLSWLLAAGLACAALPRARADYLFNEFITPSFFGEPNTEAAEWDIMYAPYNAPNYPDQFAPFGAPTTASAAGFSPPFANAWSPADPIAYWNVNNPTITQTGTNTAFIIGPGIVGNIYTPVAATSFRLNDTTSYNLGTIVLQFQTDGTAVDWSGLRLVYNLGAGDVSVAPSQLLREYHVSGSGFGGLLTRAAVQWNLNVAGLQSYRLEWAASESSLSFQRAFLDTAVSSYGNVTVVPRAGQFLGGAGANWSTAVNWANSLLPDANANAAFTGGANVTLDSSRIVGEMAFATPGNFTLTAGGGANLTVNTGFAVTTAHTVTVAAPITLGGYNLVEVAANASLRLTGVISGLYGLEKSGEGALELAADNTFNGGLSLQGGVLAITSDNHFHGSTIVGDGQLELYRDVFSGSGALGTASDPITLGLDDDVFTVTGDHPRIILVGDRQFARAVVVADSSAPKTLGVRGTTAAGAVFSGAIQVDPGAAELRLTAEGTSDRLRFTGTISGGAANVTTVRMTGPGTIEFAGVNKTYAGATAIEAGTLVLAAGTAHTGGGPVSVSSGANFLVNGALGANSTLTVAGRVGGTGTVFGPATVVAGGTVAPGAGVGALNFGGNLSFAAGAKYTWNLQNGALAPGTGWDLLTVAGQLTLTGLVGQPVTLELITLDALGLSGFAAGFDPTQDYDWVIAQAGTIFDLQGTGYFHIEAGAFANPHPGEFSLNLSPNAQTLTLHYEGAPIPESAHAALAAGLVWLLLLTKRRRKSSP